MAWRKLGLIFVPAGEHSWMHSHAANPTPEPRGGNIVRVYFGCRDRSNRSHIAWVEVELAEPPRVIRVADAPVVVPGSRGSFDDSGTSIGCLVHAGARTYLYYLGWNLGVTVPWRNSIGLAIREHPDAPFTKFSPAPLLDRSSCDPFSLSYPFVLREEGRWRMWYGSNLFWGERDREMRYAIKYAESSNGVDWHRDGEIALGIEDPQEIAVCRPWVERHDSAYRMWFCHRWPAYRLGVAESSDARSWRWTSLPDGLDVSPEGWDSEMLAYPALLRHQGRRYLFYNGNGYGKSGFGLAVEEPD